MTGLRRWSCHQGIYSRCCNPKIPMYISQHYLLICEWSGWDGLLRRFGLAASMDREHSALAGFFMRDFKIFKGW